MDKLKDIILHKKQEAIGVTLIYAVIIYLIKWGLGLNFDGLWFITGIFTGLFIIDIAETLFNIYPSPFRSVIFYVSFIIVCFFVTTSSGNFLVSGMVLAIYITLIGNILGDFKKDGNIQKYLSQLAIKIPVDKQQLMIILFIIIFCIETLFFIKQS